jgi:hypothetical protein
MYRALSLLVAPLMTIGVSPAAHAGDALSLASNPSPQISIAEEHAIGIKKVGYEVRKIGEVHGVLLPSLSEPPSLSSPFWDRPFVLSLQRTPIELQR